MFHSSAPVGQLQLWSRLVSKSSSFSGKFFLVWFYCSCCALVHNHNSSHGSCPSPVPSQESFFLFGFIVLVVPKFTIITLVKAHVQVQFLRRKVFQQKISCPMSCLVLSLPLFCCLFVFVLMCFCCCFCSAF